ncbi:MAG: 50S ribosomal protein L22 [Nitrospirae bacterium]|nr:50S ribosomal protein L22 [Nitrospirota bacterium]
MESKAILRYAQVSPRKVKRVLDLVRGKKAGDALITLRFLLHSAAKIVAKVLRSAMANAEQKKVADPDSMKISKVFVGQGPATKRLMTRAMGRSNIIKKRTSHITLILEEEQKLN